jgi:hypothetical protein
MTHEPETNRRPVSRAHRDRAEPAAIDLERLTEKVYKLMLAELRLERARGAPLVRRKEHRGG